MLTKQFYPSYTVIEPSFGVNASTNNSHLPVVSSLYSVRDDAILLEEKIISLRKIQRLSNRVEKMLVTFRSLISKWLSKRTHASNLSTEFPIELCSWNTGSVIEGCMFSFSKKHPSLKKNQLVWRQHPHNLNILLARLKFLSKRALELNPDPLEFGFIKASNTNVEKYADTKSNPHSGCADNHIYIIDTDKSARSEEKAHLAQLKPLQQSIIDFFEIEPPDWLEDEVRCTQDGSGNRSTYIDGNQTALLLPGNRNIGLAVERIVSPSRTGLNQYLNNNQADPLNWTSNISLISAPNQSQAAGKISLLNVADPDDCNEEKQKHIISPAGYILTKEKMRTEISSRSAPYRQTGVIELIDISQPFQRTMDRNGALNWA